MKIKELINYKNVKMRFKKCYLFTIQDAAHAKRQRNG